jgi:GTPase SAR1 family protein
MAGSGKSTALKTLYWLTKEQKKDIVPVSELINYENNRGATLYYDRCTFQSRKQESIFYWVYTIPGRPSYFPIRKKIFEGTDGIIFVFDSRTNLLEKNIESLKELRNISRDKLNKEIPLIILLNKQDLEDSIEAEDFKRILIREKIWHESNRELSIQNLLLFDTCALYDERKNIYNSFYECTRKIGQNLLSETKNAPILTMH